MKITLDGQPHYTSPEDVAKLKSDAPDHEVWFRVALDGQHHEFFYLRASPRIGQDRMREIIDRLLASEQAKT